MSLFSNDMRVANTATPSFDHLTNVGQFGWTGADSANYNQLIQYVDECRKIWLNLEEKILYVEKILETVTNIDDQVKYVEVMTSEVMKWRQEVLTSRDLVNSMYNQLVPLFEDFNPKYEDGVKKYAEVIKMHSEVELNAAAAALSELAAAKSAQEAADVAEELRKGQVYRGTWNIQANNGYPPKPDTNSVWDITLNEGVIEFRFDNTIWYWGDRLLFLKDDDKFTQIEAGGSVTSVNGKKGAVTITATDVGARPDDWLPTADEVGARPDDWMPTASQVGALPITGGTLTGQTIINHDAGLQVRAGDYGIRMINSGSTLYHQAGKMDRDVNDQKLSMTGWYGTPLSFFRVSMAEGKYAYIQQGGTDFRIYHQGYKPTVSDVGAAPRGYGLGENQAWTVPDMDTDPLTWNSNGNIGWIRAISTTANKPYDQVGVGTIQRYQSGSSSNVFLHFLANNSRTYTRRWNGSTWEGWVTTYATNAKPSAADVGAVPLTDISTSGEWGKIPKMHTGGSLEVGPIIDFHYESGVRDFDSRLQVTRNSDGTNYTLNVTGSDLSVAGNLYEKGQRVYSEGNRPTAAAVGAVAKDGDSRIVGSLEISKDLSVEGRANFTKNPGGVWISTVSGEVGHDKVVTGSLSGGATVGAHNERLDNWTPLYLNTYAAAKDNYPNAPVVIGYPTRQISINNDAGTTTAIQYPIVSKGKRAGSPNWWLSGSVLRFMDGIDLMMAATNGVRRNPDWSYMSRFKYSVRLTVHAPTASVWSHKYSFDIYNYQPTNAPGQTYIIPHQFDCHAGSGAQAVIQKQLVPSSENGGLPYFEVHFPAGMDVAGDPQLEVQLEIVAVNLFE